MVTKNPFERGIGSGIGEGKSKPKPYAPPRPTAMALTTGQEGVDVNSHNKAPENYRTRIPQPDAELDTPGVRMDPAKKTQQATVTGGEQKNPFDHPVNRRAGGLLSTSAGFEVMDSKTKKEDKYVKKFKEEYQPEAKKPEVTRNKKLTADNYQKAYREKQAAEKLEAEKNVRIQKKKDEEQEKRKATAYISRARELKGQIASWRMELGKDSNVDGGIQSIIDRLQLELSQIPVAYKQ